MPAFSCLETLTVSGQAGSDFSPSGTEVVLPQNIVMGDKEIKPVWKFESASATPLDTIRPPLSPGPNPLLQPFRVTRPKKRIPSNFMGIRVAWCMDLSGARGKRVDASGGAGNRIPTGNRIKAPDLRRKCHRLRLEA